MRSIRINLSEERDADILNFIGKIPRPYISESIKLALREHIGNATSATKVVDKKDSNRTSNSEGDIFG